MIDFIALDRKWQQRWTESKVFESNPDHRKKIFTSIIIPYVNGDMHIGHAFTYTRTDIYSRFKRMQGFNVLLTQGFHATGEPILGVVERLRKNDETQLRTYKMLGISNDEIENFKERGAEYVARFWARRITESAKSVGFSIDWRRCFITAIEPCFNRFIEWQYTILKEKGYVKQGTHPVVWCPHCQSPTGDHDRLEGEGESPVEFIVMKFDMDEELSGKTIKIPCATLRPETIYGVTNIWMNPNTEYIIAMIDKEYTDVGGEVWIISKSCAEKLRDQLYDVQEIGRVHAKELIGKKVREPMNNREIPILPGEFVDPNNATGIVMSVPSHAPYDWIALKDLMNAGIGKYGVDSVEPISVITVEGFGEHPAIEICELMKITSQKQTEKLDQATSLLYKKEFHLGFLNNNCKEYAGKKVSEIKEHLTNVFIMEHFASLMWETTGRIVCRCTTPCNIKILEDQWFNAYSDESWKRIVLSHMKEMKFYPDEARTQAENTIQWLKDKACARKTGLGTKMPWDKEWIIETLSDSTIYMAFYTIAHKIHEHNITPDQLSDSVFDYVFRNIGNVKDVSGKSRLSEKVLSEMKNQFEYFYPVDMRNSGKDLLQHHLMFYLFHHVAIFDTKHWPLAIGVNGYVNVEGEKMSKSKGNFLPLKDLVDKHGADLVRINIAAAAESMDDADWRADNINSYKSRIGFLHQLVSDMHTFNEHKKRLIDRWLDAEINNYVRDAGAAYDDLKFRTAMQHALFDTINALKWYLKRTGKNADRKTVKDAVDIIIRLIAPMTPHVCEEIWERLENKGFIANAAWPKFDAQITVEASKAEKAEGFIKKTLEGVNGIKKIVKRLPKRVVLFVARTNAFDSKDDKAMQMTVLNDARQFFVDELRCEFDILDSDDVKTSDPEIYQKKAVAAKPEKLGIVIE